jgi:hypothetical protein
MRACVSEGKLNLSPWQRADAGAAADMCAVRGCLTHVRDVTI